ncbi:hypothetical protein IJG72_03185 [bacterium]|nr:hypothetical protein [bacterium]
MIISDIIKNLIIGFWRNGVILLCKTVLEHLILSLLIIVLIAYLCSDSETAVYAWFLIGIFAIYSAVKAIVDIFIETKNYIKAINVENKTFILQNIGGKIFDFILCAVGIFQTLRIFTHMSRITKSTSSAMNVVDDVAGAISKFLENLKR